jgi:NitT/TauT family transport system substrate-binding protein
MRMKFLIAARPLVAALVGLLASGGLGATSGRAAEQPAPPVAVQFSLDRPIDGVAAPFVLAGTRGLFRAEGLNVSINAATSTQDAIARVASGASDIALADINALVRYRDGADAVPVKAVFVLLNEAPYAVIARRSRGVVTLPALDGKTLGVADGDLAIRLWPALARRNGINAQNVKQEKLSTAVREPMLSAGQVDAVTGFSYLSAVNLRDRGVPADDLAVFRYADYGCVAYGQALIVNPKFAAARPEAVKAFLRATIAAMRLTITHPGRAIDDVLTQMDSGSRDLELQRLAAVLHDNILTDEVRLRGVGGIDPARFEAAIDAIGEDIKFRKRPVTSDIFDDSFLPAQAERSID